MVDSRVGLLGYHKKTRFPYTKFSPPITIDRPGLKVGFMMGFMVNINTCCQFKGVILD
jgi:hypothetical protein